MFSIIPFSSNTKVIFSILACIERFEFFTLLFPRFIFTLLYIHISKVIILLSPIFDHFRVLHKNSEIINIDKLSYFYLYFIKTRKLYLMNVFSFCKCMNGKTSLIAVCKGTIYFVVPSLWGVHLFQVKRLILIKCRSDQHWL
jgi:hypothetical protein